MKKRRVDITNIVIQHHICQIVKNNKLLKHQVHVPLFSTKTLSLNKRFRNYSTRGKSPTSVQKNENKSESIQKRFIFISQKVKAH